jgi:hypothetical protein
MRPDGLSYLHLILGGMGYRGKLIEQEHARVLRPRRTARRRGPNALQRFVVDEERLRPRRYLHEGLDLDAAFAHWSAITNIPPEQFTTSYRAVPDPGIRRATHEFGCVSVRDACTRTYRTVMGSVRALLACDTAIPG